MTKTVPSLRRMEKWTAKCAAIANMLFVAVSSTLVEWYDKRSNHMKQTFSSPTGDYRLSVEYLGILGVMQCNMWDFQSPKDKDRGTASTEWRCRMLRFSN